jgi:hypothetical protein
VNGVDTAAAARVRLERVAAELDARRELRERHTVAARAQAGESTRKIGPVVEQVAGRLADLGRRRREAGGWVTARTHAGDDDELAFEPEDGEPERAEPRRPVPAARRTRRPPSDQDMDDDEFTTLSWLED